MECKFCIAVTLKKLLFELIDTLWNVNDSEFKEIARKADELIDTLWNVNILADTLKKGKDVELIDTLWNVNILGVQNVEENTRINRYIMECKYSGTVSILVVFMELIDTLWNVNKVEIKEIKKEEPN